CDAMNRRMLTTLSLAAVMALPIGSAVTANPASAAAAEQYPIASQPFMIEGTSSSIGTINKDGSTYIALRHLNTELGFTTSYDPVTRLIQVSGKGRMMEIDLSNDAIKLNGQPVFGPQTILQDGTTYLPLRFLLERFGSQVTYDSGSKTIGLTAIPENDLTLTAHEVAADGDDKSLLVHYPVLSGFKDAAVQQKINDFLKQEADRFVANGSQEMDVVVQGNEQLLAQD